MKQRDVYILWVSQLKVVECIFIDCANISLAKEIVFSSNCFDTLSNTLFVVTDVHITGKVFSGCLGVHMV